MPDFPDFTVPKWNRRDWAIKEKKGKTIRVEGYGPFDPGSVRSGIIYTIPDGKRLYLGDIQYTTEVKGKMFASVPYKYYLFEHWMEPYSGYQMSYSFPFRLDSGDELYYHWVNKDIVSGGFLFYFFGWETSASEPEKPKNDDPEELYRTGEFNYCNVICLPNDEQIFLFSKIGENIRHFLKVKNYGLKSQKKLASFHLRPEHAQEILDISHASPQKVKEVLAEYEKKYKPKKIWG